MKKHILKIMTVVLFALVLVACGNNNDGNSNNNSNNANGDVDFPTKNINGIIMWGEGGATDIIGRTLAPIVEEELDGSFVMQNKAGAAGAIATQFVYDEDADGHTVLFGAENPNLYQVLDISDRSYQEDFVPVSIIANSYAGIIVKADSEFETLEDVVEYAQANKDDLIFGTSGDGGLPSVVLAMLDNELDTSFKTVPYDGEGPLATALLGKEIDITSVTISAAQEYVDSGDFRMLAVVNDEPVSSIPDVKPITEIYSEIDKYLPWGPFQGVFVHKDTPEEIVQVLSDSFEKAVEDEEFKETLDNLGMNYMNINGQEAIDFVDANRSTATWMLYQAGETEFSPEEFDIPEP